jgi:acyl-CoA reductase-like NAD-dependent aldehyde dehydrogenase
MPAVARRDILFKVAELLEAKKGELGEAYVHDTNVAPIVVSSDQGFALSHLKSGGTIATEVRGEIPQTTDGSLALVTREPYGVVYSVCPFNMGLTLCVRTFCYALACGNTVVVKASPAIPFLHYSLGPLLKEAGVPDGVVQILQYAPGTEAQLTEQVIAHPHVRMANFTGSTKVGSSIGALCGKYIKPCLLELGGKAPIVVLESADLKMAANNIVFGALLHSGQICMSSERVIVVESVADKLVHEIQEIAKSELERLYGWVGSDFAFFR